MKTSAIVAAAGAGLRMETATRKQYLMLKEIPVLIRSLNLFKEHPSVTEIIAVIPPGDEQEVLALLESYGLSNMVILVQGGATRQESVARGLKAMAPADGFVCIHDAARPLASPGLLDYLLETAARWGAAVPVLDPGDTIKEVDDRGFVMSTPERQKLRLVQTPQVFRRDLIVLAYEEALMSRQTATDDASLVELLGKPVKTVPGEPDNFKITTPRDLILASLMLKGAGK